MTVLEADNRIGGRAWTESETFGSPYDQGCHWLHHASTNAWRDYAKRYGFDVYPDDADECCLYLVEYYSGMLSDPQFETFDSWGNYDGSGTEITGGYFGNKAHIRVFSCSLEHRSFSIVEFSYKSDEWMTRPGFEQIENSFEMEDVPLEDPAEVNQTEQSKPPIPQQNPGEHARVTR